MIPLRTTSFQRIQRYSWCYVPSRSHQNADGCDPNIVAEWPCMLPQLFRGSADSTGATTSWGLGINATIQQKYPLFNKGISTSFHCIFKLFKVIQLFLYPGSITAEFAGLGVSSAIAWLSKSLSSSPTCGRCDSTRYKRHPWVAGDSEEITVGGTQQELWNVLKGIGRDLEGLIYLVFHKRWVKCW